MSAAASLDWIIEYPFLLIVADVIGGITSNDRRFGAKNAHVCAAKLFPPVTV